MKREGKVTPRWNRPPQSVPVDVSPSSLVPAVLGVSRVLKTTLMFGDLPEGLTGLGMYRQRDWSRWSSEHWQRGQHTWSLEASWMLPAPGKSHTSNSQHQKLSRMCDVSVRGSPLETEGLLEPVTCFVSFAPCVPQCSRLTEGKQVFC